jgi:hypothetical protein
MFLATLAVPALHVVAFDVAELVSGPPLAGRGAWNVLSRLALVLTAAGAAVAAIGSQREHARQEQQSPEMTRRLAELDRRRLPAYAK